MSTARLHVSIENSAAQSTASTTHKDMASGVAACAAPLRLAATPPPPSLWLQTLLDALDDAVLALTPDGALIELNRAAKRLLAEAKPSQLAWQQILTMAKVDAPHLQQAWLTLTALHAVSTQCMLQLPSGECIIADIMLRAIEQHSETAVLVRVRDISAQKAHEDRLRRLASTDDLTQVSNRRHFMETLAQETERARRYHKPLALLMVDADHFKRINDVHGHEAGDRALQLLAHVARTACRSADVIGRLGGEEFAVLLPETSRERALYMAERLRSAVETTRLQTAASTVNLTVSIGVAAASGAHCHGAELLRRADQALYLAKRAGRNRVVVAKRARREASA